MRMRITFSAIVMVSALGLGSKCSSNRNRSNTPETLPWNMDRATRDLKEISAQPHPLGSARIAVLADYLEKEMKQAGLDTGRDRFTALVPDPELLLADPNPMRSTTLSIPMQNIYARTKTGRESCVFLVGSHYDSKRLPAGNSIGANDSGSSSAALLELMRGLQSLKAEDAIDLRCHIMAVWFDGEEAYLEEWRDGQTRHPARIVDNTYGSRHMADNLKPCTTAAADSKGKNWCLPDQMGGDRVEGIIVLDMVGMPNLQLTQETSSSRELLKIAMDVDQQLFQGKLFSRSQRNMVEDDHIAFLEKGLPALDLIGFENLDTWHTPADTFETVSMQSVEESARLTHGILQALLAPK